MLIEDTVFSVREVLFIGSSESWSYAIENFKNRIECKNRMTPVRLITLCIIRDSF